MAKYPSCLNFVKLANMLELTNLKEKYTNLVYITAGYDIKISHC